MPTRPLSLGVDLAASEKRPTGMCLLDASLRARTWTVLGDEEIIKGAKEAEPDIVAIDAPLSLPRRGALRSCDRELLKRGIRLLPPALGAMMKLTLRGIRIRRMLEEEGYTVIEVLPGGAQDVWGIPRKRRRALLEGLRRLGIRGLSSEVSVDELDAATAALVGLLYLRGEVELIECEEGAIVMPKPPGEGLLTPER